MKSKPLFRLVFIYVALFAGLGSAGFSLASQGGRISPLLDVFSHFAPLYAVGGLVTLGMALVLAGTLRRVVASLGAVAVVAASALLAPEFLPAPPFSIAGAAPGFRIVTFNAWAPNQRSEAAYRWLVAQNADALILVEGGVLPERLQKEAGYFPSCLPCDVTVMTRRKPLAIYPPTALIADQPYLTSATVADEGGEITIVGVHRDWPIWLRGTARQTRAIDALVASKPRERMILGGDFNSTPWSFARRRDDRAWGLLRRTRALPTWPAARVSHNPLPAPFPYLPIDHIYAGPEWATVSVSRGPELGSDHYPVVAVFARATPTKR